MNEHDIVEMGECSVTCRCGRTFSAPSLEQAKHKHTAHFGVEASRAALRGARSA